jgi:hypothetical protein
MINRIKWQIHHSDNRFDILVAYTSDEAISILKEKFFAKKLQIKDIKNLGTVTRRETHTKQWKEF